MFFIISSAILSVQAAQISTTLLYFSPLVIKPFWYCCSNSLTCLVVSAMSSFLASGTIKSSLPNEIPALQALVKPKVIILSTMMQVSFWPQWRYTVSMISEISFFLIKRFTNENGICGFLGKMSETIIRPGVVSTKPYLVSPLSSTYSIRHLILACKSTTLAFNANITSSASA